MPAANGIAPPAERDAPLRDGAAGIGFLGGREALDSRRELERVQESHRAGKRRLRRGVHDVANRTVPSFSEPAVLMVLRPGDRGKQDDRR